MAGQGLGLVEVAVERGGDEDSEVARSWPLDLVGRTAGPQKRVWGVCSEG